MKLERSISGARYVTLEPAERETLERAAAILEEVRTHAHEASQLDIDTAVAADTLLGLAGARDSFGYLGIAVEP